MTLVAACLPASVREIADVIGVERALFLIGQLPRCYAGNEGHRSNRVIMYVPTLPRLKPDHELVRVLGWPDAMKLCEVFGGEILQPANCAGIYRAFRDQHIRRLIVQGMAPRLLGHWFGMTDRAVRLVAHDLQLVERNLQARAGVSRRLPEATGATVA